MTKRVQLPNGRVVEFPDEATNEQIEAFLNEGGHEPQEMGLTTGRNWATRNISEPFNQGILNLLGILPGGDDLQASAEHLGFAVPPEHRGEGVVPRSMEILGGSMLPGGMLTQAGKQVLARGIPTAQQTVLQHMAAQTAAAPKMTAATELLGAYGAGLGGEVVATETDDPTMQMYGEIGGGLLSALAPILSPAAWAARQARQTLQLRSPEHRAARQIQNTVPNPNQAAQRIDVESPMPPARQVEEPRLLALEDQVRMEGSPKDADSINRHIEDTIRQAEDAAINLPGDTNAALAQIQEQGRKTVQAAADRAAKAADAAEQAIGKLDPGASVADMSKGARDKVNAAMEAATALEREAWKRVGFDSPGSYNNTKQAVEEIKGMVGKRNQKKVVPKEVREELELFKDSQPTLRDIHDLRKDIQGLKGAAQLDPEKRKDLAVLGKLEEALLRDMDAVQTANPGALQDARAATADIYTRFRRGGLGRVLGYGERGTERVLDVDTLQNLAAGRNAARNLEQLLAAAPGSKTEAMDYYRNMFLSKAVRDGQVSKGSAQSFIKRLRDNRIFDVLPELESEFLTAATTSDAASLLARRSELVGKRGGARYSKSVDKSLASLYAEGVEADILLDPKTTNAPRLAERLLNRMEGNQAAEDGLRRSFVESLWKRASSGVDPRGNDMHSAGKMARLLADNRETMKALNFSDEQVENLDKLTTLMRQAQAKPSGSPGEELTDITAWVYERLARMGGARWSGFANKLFGGGGAGVSLQDAQLGSSAARQAVKALRVDPARRLVADAMDDPALMKSLLLKETATTKERDAAMKAVHAWAVGVGLADEDDLQADDG